DSGKLRGVASGLTDLDNLLGGLQRGDLVILAARPSIGKTSLALDIARNVAVREKVPVGLFSLEMSKEQLVDRLLVSEANVDLWKMRTGKLTEDADFSRIGHAMGVLSEAQLFIDDSAVTTVLEMRTKARRLQSEHGLGLIIIDYLQLMEGRADAENRVLQIAEITRGLKGLAKELNVPVLALSQLSRATELRSPPIPKLSDLRESGSIEQDADVVIFLYREEYYRPDTNRKGIADIIVGKHRNGPTGQIQAFFDQAKTSFRNLDKQHQAPPPF
ncbi:MAG: replicative DNA helicase, partial [Candidatus Kerfeldbacteria bacterium]|nr:replicative DNA helicase [Candidatus Kerfeldbacteria bacterium]